MCPCNSWILGCNSDLLCHLIFKPTNRNKKKKKKKRSAFRLAGNGLGCSDYLLPGEEMFKVSSVPAFILVSDGFEVCPGNVGHEAGIHNR